MRQTTASFFRRLQLDICSSLEEIDGQAKFNSDSWKRPDSKTSHGGGGISSVIKNGFIFEQAGVNFSEVSGNLPLEMSKRLTSIQQEQPFFATGVSLVLHPNSPMVPTTHANFRYLEVGQLAWFGGGMDLTPYYLFEEDAQHFHQVIKTTCDRHSQDYYPKFKKWCDDYFYLPHRQESRGIGGLFFDYLGKDGEELDSIFEFVQDIGAAFLDAYLPIVSKRQSLSYGEHERSFQLLRRGRYVEFNLLYDRGTQFGLQTGGRTESILMSLPPLVKWEYCTEIKPNSREAELMQVLQHPKDWIC